MTPDSDSGANTYEGEQPRASWSRQGQRPLGETGFTIVEAVVALLLATLALSLAYGSYSFLSRLKARWKSRMALENTVHSIGRDLTRRALRARQVRAGGTAWTFLTRGDSTTYRRDGTTLLRNGQPTHRKEVNVTAFSITILNDGGRGRGASSNSAGFHDRNARPYSEGAQWNFGSPEVEGVPDRGDAVSNVEGPHAEEKGPFMRLRLSVAICTDTLTIDTSVSLRQPASWRPLSKASSH